MIIKSLKLKDYRNYEILNIEFDHATNIFYGDNAQGKTNILEGVYSVSYTHLRAHETRHDLVCRLLLEKKKKKNIQNEIDRQTVKKHA